MGSAHVAIAFWVFVAVASVAGIVADVLKRRETLKTLRAAIEKGQALDPKVVEALLARAHADDGPVEPAHLEIGGIITFASGVAAVALAWFIDKMVGNAFHIFAGLGVAAACVGVGLVASARVLARHRDAANAGTDRAA